MNDSGRDTQYPGYKIRNSWTFIPPFLMKQLTSPYILGDNLETQLVPLLDFDTFIN